MGKVFLIGAGFSKGLASAPVTYELFELVINNSQKIVEGDRSGWFKEAKNFLKVLNHFQENVNKAFEQAGRQTTDLVTVSGYYPINLEYLCTVLELNAKYACNPDSKKVGLDFPVPFLLGFSVRELERIVEYLKTQILNRLLPVNLNPQKDLLDHFASFLEVGDSILTFNYDLVLDQALFRNDLWNPIDGYGFSRPVFDSELKEDPGKSQIQLLKLHGSINWKIEPKHKFKNQVEIQLNYQSKDKKFFPGLETEAKRVNKKEANYFRNPAILPTFIKMYSEHWFTEIINKASDCIRNADEVFIIGYSLPKPDSLGRFLIANLPRDKKISIINYSDTNELKVELKNKFDFKNINFLQVPVENWVKQFDPPQK